MKRMLNFGIIFCLMMCLLAKPVWAADESRNYNFELTVDGTEETLVTPGQIVTVTLGLNRTDSDQPAEMYAVQAELLYDDAFFELVDGSIMTSSGIEWTDMARRTGGRAFYLNFLSMTGGESWESKTRMGSFQLRVIGESGASVIESDNCIVSVKSGKDHFSSTASDAKVIVTTECRVQFESGGGSSVQDQFVQYGEKIIEPEEPVRDGYTFNGWYKDMDRTELWNFQNDTVTGNMTLFAGWMTGTAVIPDTPVDGNTMGVIVVLIAALVILLCLIAMFGKKRVSFHTAGGTFLETVYVKKNSVLDEPMTPVKEGAFFVGWFTKPVGGEQWNFRQDKVRKSMTLYAHWK